MSSRPTPIDLPRDGDTVSAVAQRAVRLLVIAAAVGVLLMHGADASAAATHESAPTVAHEHHGEDETNDDPAVHWHYVALACIAVLTAVIAVVHRGRQSKLVARVAADGSMARRRRPAPLLLNLGPPLWLELAVIRR